MHFSANLEDGCSMVLLRSLLSWYTPLLLLALWAVEVRAQTASDSTEPKVLFAFDRTQAETPSQAVESPTAQIPATATPPAELDEPVVSLPLGPLPKPIVDDPIIHEDLAVVPATQTTEIVSEETVRDSRRLAPFSRKDLLDAELVDSTPRAGKLPFEIPNISSLGTAGTGLVLVVGLFLVCVSLMRRGGPSPTSPLPRDAVAVLGRIPLAPKQFAHLLQVGNKLVLISISADRTDTITEVTEPAEVDRLLTLCTKGSKQSSSAEFQRMLQQMSKEPARGFLGKQAATAYSGSARG
jgi:flagellar biogenesis protein FliO